MSAFGTIQTFVMIPMCIGLSLLVDLEGQLTRQIPGLTIVGQGLSDIEGLPY